MEKRQTNTYLFWVKKIKKELRLRKKDKKGNYLVKEVNQNERMSKKHKNVCRTFNYIEHLHILASTLDVLQFLLLIP